jgi:cytochrome c-type biogenesis protein CcmH/NrfF
MASGRAFDRRNLLLLALAALVAVVFLAIGSVHGAPESDAARVAHLESVLKCPSCADLSIAQSTSPVAQALDADVQRDVHAGMSDAAIEQAVLQEYPGSILLPEGGIGVAVVAIPIAVIALGAAVGGAFLYRRRRGGPRRPSRAAPDEELRTELAPHG